MEFRILGPLEVVSNGEALDLGGQKQRALLAVLVLHANEVVSSDRLIEALWQDEPPDTAQKAVQVYVSQLRKLLGRERLQTRPPGYLLRVDEGELDLARFRTLRAEDRPHEALSIWRGPPLGDFAYHQFAQADIARLEELRLACSEDRIERDLTAGLHADLAGELETLVAEHPLRERFRGQLMLALYRSGRQAEALEVYQAGRRMLVDELGLEPEEALKGLERSILEHDPGLDLPVRGDDRSEADVATTAPPAEIAAPRQSRKTVTALFVALVIAGGLETLDPEAHRRIIHGAVGEVRAAGMADLRRRRRVCGTGQSIRLADGRTGA
jgi:DNA-binding SARP family transcriptional activator